MAMSPDEQAVYKNMVENLSFMKRQQWLITGYTVAAFVGLYGLTNGKINPNAIEFLIWLVIAGCILCCYFILRIQFDIARQRRRIQQVDNAHFEPAQIQRFGTYRFYFFRDIDFLIGFICVVIVSAWVVVYLWQHPA
jgi:hypothetical protein